MTALAELLRPLAEHRRAVWTLALVLLGTYAYFVPAPAWNQNSRFALTRALVERGSTIIDDDHETTGDKSFKDGHFYCDKAPGASVLAAVPYAIVHGISRVLGAEPPGVSVIPLDPRDLVAGRAPTPAERLPGDRLHYNRSHRLGLYLAGVFSVGVLSVLGSLALWLLVRRAGCSVATASACTLTYALATPALPYSTALYGHQLCGALLLIAFVGAAVPARGRFDRTIAIVVGLAAGLAVATEYTAVVPAALVAGLCVVRHGLRASLPIALGALPSVVLLAAYHTAAFGHPLATGYDYVWLPEFAEGMRVRYGIGRPSAQVLLAIGFGSYRGLFYLAPICLLALWGLLRELWRPTLVGRDAIAIAVACCAWFVLLNAGYYMWDGGAAIGPRHVVPMLGLLALGLPVARTIVPGAFAVIAFVSAAQMLLATAAMPEAPQFGDPLWEFALGHVLGRAAATDAIASNLGLLLGLPGAWSLLPLLVLWAWALPLAREAHARSDG
ncbi:MAG: hypothetical protein IAG13_28410 [Deltaproteobacteria bacterium]|nr:hypothetical protein [Nannocystaceae bacterium]